MKSFQPKVGSVHFKAARSGRVNRTQLTHTCNSVVPRASLKATRSDWQKQSCKNCSFSIRFLCVSTKTDFYFLKTKRSRRPYNTFHPSPLLSSAWLKLAFKSDTCHQTTCMWKTLKDPELMPESSVVIRHRDFNFMNNTTLLHNLLPAVV